MHSLGIETSPDNASWLRADNPLPEPHRTPQAGIKKGPLGPGVSVWLAANERVSEYDVAMRAYLIPAYGA